MDSYLCSVEAFAFDTLGGRGHLWHHPEQFTASSELEEGYAVWRRNTAAIPAKAVVDRAYLKVTDAGYAFILGLAQNGELLEAALTDLEDTWTGRWMITSGDRDDNGFREAESGQLFIAIGEWESLYFLHLDTGVLAGPEHSSQGNGHSYIWLADLTEPEALAEARKHLNDEQQHLITAFLATLNTEEEPSPSLAVFVEALIDEAHGPGLTDPDLRARMMSDLMQRTVDLINRRLIDALSESQALELEALIDKEPPDPDAIDAFIGSCLPHRDEVVTAALLELKALYIKT